MTSSSRIYRSKNEYIIAGVCGGLAEHFNIDPTIVRIIFILLTLGGGSGILIYIILWLVLPMEGKNEPDDLKDRVKEISEEFKNNYSNREKRGNFLGIIILLIGVVALLDQIQPAIIRWDIFWPAVLIMTGLFLIFRKR